MVYLWVEALGVGLGVYIGGAIFEECSRVRTAAGLVCLGTLFGAAGGARPCGILANSTLAADL